MNAEPNNPLHNVPLATLAAEFDMAKDDMAAAKERAALISAEITRRYKDDFTARFAQDNKMSGEITIEREGFKLTGEIKKDVKWDNAILMKVASEMTMEQIQRYFKVQFSIPEAVFKSLELAEAPLAEKVKPARVTKYTELSVTLKAAG